MRGSSFFGKMQSLHSYQYSHSMFKQWVARERYWLIFTEWVILSIWLLSITLEQMPWCPIQLVHLHISNLPILPVSCSWLTNQAICPCPETCMYPYLWTLLPYKAKNQVYHLYLCPLEGFPSKFLAPLSYHKHMGVLRVCLILTKDSDIWNHLYGNIN